VWQERGGERPPEDNAGWVEEEARIFCFELFFHDFVMNQVVNPIELMCCDEPNLVGCLLGNISSCDTPKFNH
jgi:hypothetical protein